MKISKKMLMLPLITTSLAIPTTLVVSCSTNPNEETTESTKWIDSIKESSDNQYTKLFFNRHAALAYQQELLVADYMYYAKERTGNDDLLWFFNYDGLQIWNNQHLVDTWTSNDGNDYTFKLVSNASDIDSSFDKTINYYQYPSTSIMENLLKKYDQSTDKFDLWIVDAGLNDMWNFAKKEKSEAFYNFFKKINKIYVVTDGNLQTYSFVKWVQNKIQTTGYKQLSQNEIDDKFNSYRNDETNSKIDDFYNYDLYDFIHYQNMFTVFHTQEYTNSSYYQLNDGIELYKTYAIDYNYYKMGKTLLGDDNEKLSKFVNDYEVFFKLTDFKTINDFFWANVDSYDPKKNNLIWMGDSLIINDKNVYIEKTLEMRNVLKSYMDKFSDYNFIAKFHPVYQEPHQVEYVEWLLGKEEAKKWVHYKQIPWELFLSWDYKQSQLDQNYQPFFSQNSNDGEKSKTKIVGFQYTTTSIQTTAFFLSNTYNMSIDNINKTVDSADFPIPETFDVVTRTTSYSVDPVEQLEINKGKIKDIYEPFVLNNTFPHYEKYQVSATKYINDNYNSKYVIGNDGTSTN